MLFLKEGLTMWSPSFDFAVHADNRFEGEVVAEERKWGDEGSEEGLEALFI